MPNQIWIDIDQPKITTEYQPPSLVFPMTFNHVFSDRSTLFFLNLEVKFSEIKVGSQIFHLELSPKIRSETYRLEFALFRELLHLIESKKEEKKESDITWKLSIKGKIYQRATNGALVDERSISSECEFRTSISEWKVALGLENYQFVLLPNELLDELETLRKKWGFWKIDDVIAKFLDVYKGERVEISQQFLVTLYETRSIRDKLAEFADKSANFREIRVASLYIDPTGAEYLIKMLKNGVKVKLLTRSKVDRKAHHEALNVLKQLGAEIRYDKMLHARIVIFDDIAAIISSADLDSEGLNNQKQAGILTFDRIVVRDAITFFDKAWEMAGKSQS